MRQPRTTVSCRVCGGGDVTEWLYPREMMFGLREQFAYFRCSLCGSLQLADVPPDMSKYYPANYYSYTPMETQSVPWKKSIKRRILYPLMTAYKLGWGSALGHFLCRFKPGPPVPNWLTLLDRPVPLDGG